MLNRRSLRIKVMQHLYALERQKEALMEMAKEQSTIHFNPNLNTNVAQDTDMLKKLKAEALTGLDDQFRQKISVQDFQPEVNKAIKAGLVAYQNLLKETECSGLKHLLAEADLILNSYFKLLWLPVAWRRLILKGENTKAKETVKPENGHKNFTSNPIILAIDENTLVKDYFLRHKSEWDTTIITDWFRQLIKKEAFYSKYVLVAHPTMDDHKELLLYLYKNIVFKHEVIGDYMQQFDLSWSENKTILKSMIIKTLKTYDETNATISMINLSPNWEEDKCFYKDLYQKTLGADTELEKLISSKSKNWDSERIAAVDKIIMKMAITEFTHFPSIPVKVTINEYIEICKSYSTPKSKQFVNGILDVLSNELTVAGKIQKSGRGLLDNK